ncbi:phage shock protein PspC (stress-responsive transcriptional regulator) [Catalinimonas alkaloidigena]|uniref:PspC domain-containing protein n=1 Tax=Catalinimonas alkaloidigena TaxID=1075417 RepID=UPI00240491A0|nr:PspC domain-containing protein [Catalinimonas alkaloidigena]MDF9798317.1 phage shock protein PspC (stress-responsive transcriptional regulator) [Catalinimonas alkaloidigena]
MKKNISINISGIIFHVEEDGYELLKNYLESISRYFSTYEDSKEITDDIESRIAEIFLSKLSNSKQVITREDVEGVIKTMGNVEDFAAAEGMEEDTSYKAYSSAEDTKSEAYEETYGRKRLYRDTERKVLGGVAAGIAHYFKTDPLWIRLAFLIFFFADAFASFGTITLVTYIVLWIVLPGNDALSLNAKVKKLFRNPDDKVIGGVSGGIAAYFGSDPTVIRLLFVLSIFLGGTGLLIYVILWIITPEAKSLTDKMQMKGEPVTLTNIESSIKKNFSVDENGEESLLLKIILFPFRLIAIVINALGRALGPMLNVLGDLARVLLGLLLILIGGAFVFSLLVSGGILLGLSSFDPVIDGEIPLRLLQESIPATASVFAFIAIFIPAVALIISGIAVIVKRKLINSTVGWSAFGLWLVALIGLSVTVPQVIMDFREEGRYTINETLSLEGTTALLTLGSYPESNDFARPRLMLRGHEEGAFELEKEFEARGRNRKAAIEYAQMVAYEVEVEDSIISFPPVFTFSDDAKFRDQEVEVTLYVPYQYPFMIDRELSLILRNTLYRDGYSISDVRDNTFMFTEQGLECISCEERENLDDEIDSIPPSGISGGFSRTFEVSNFEVLNIAGPFRVEVKQDIAYSLTLTGDEEAVNEVDINTDHTALELRYGQAFTNDDKERIAVRLTMPTLSALRLNANAQVNVSDFETENLSLDMAGSSEAFVKAEVQSISLNMRGASGLKLYGNAQQIDANLSGAARLDAMEMEIVDASVESSGASKAKMNVSGELNVDPEDSSRIEYSGEPTLNVSNGNENKVTKIE